MAKLIGVMIIFGCPPMRLLQFLSNTKTSACWTLTHISLLQRHRFFFFWKDCSCYHWFNWKWISSYSILNQRRDPLRVHFKSVQAYRPVHFCSYFCFLTHKQLVSVNMWLLIERTEHGNRKTVNEARYQEEAPVKTTHNDLVHLIIPDVQHGTLCTRTQYYLDLKQSSIFLFFTTKQKCRFYQPIDWTPCLTWVNMNM